RNDGGLNLRWPRSSANPTSYVPCEEYVSGGMGQRTHPRCSKTWRPRSTRSRSDGSAITGSDGGGGGKVWRNDTRSATWSGAASAACMVCSRDFWTWSCRYFMSPFQPHGSVRRVFSKVRVRLGVPNVLSPNVSARRPFVWPSVWQLW